MTDLIGITSAIDHIVYMILNAIATILWRLDAAIISMSLYSYGTQDWLTGTGGNGGVWGVLEWLIGPGGLAGLTTWTLFGSLALMLWGLAKIGFSQNICDRAETVYQNSNDTLIEKLPAAPTPVGPPLA